jgi:PKD repeat protein
MSRRVSVFVLLAALALAGTMSGIAASHTFAAPRNATTSLAVPSVDPNYIYDQLAYMVTSFQRREAGYDNNLPVAMNGHDEFATYWTQEIQKDLAGFGPSVRRDTFPIAGWSGRPAIVPAFNVEVTVPGETQAGQVVVIGCHYDGEASSTQSANDDGSGCAIELGVAKAMAEYWRIHHVYPARTLRFVLFDAEEQGLYGSFHYLNSTVNGDVGNFVAMFNEEQNGIAYPLRFLGKMSNPLLPFYVDISPLQNNQLYPNQSQLPQTQIDRITRFRALLAEAYPAVFTEFQALGYTTLDYRDPSGQTDTQPVFTADQLGNVQPEDDTLGSSDQVPFTLAGVACATFVGNSTYYDRNPPPWSYPFDQPQDTIQLMNTYASGTAAKAPALGLALALPGMLTTWMLSQPNVLGESPADVKPLAAIGDVGVAQAGQSLALDASASYDPTGRPLASYAWSFGDGATASGPTVTHTYATPGTYALALTVAGPSGSRTTQKSITVGTQPTTYPNPYAQFPQNGRPPANPAVTLPIPNGALSSSSPGPTGGELSGVVIALAVLFVLAILVALGAALVFTLRKNRA